MTDLSPALLRFGDVSVRLSVELGRTDMPLRDVLALGQGSVVALNRMTDELLDITANGKVVAQGEVIADSGKFALRIVNMVGDAPSASSGALPSAIGTGFPEASRVAGAPAPPPSTPTYAPQAEAISSPPPASAAPASSSTNDRTTGEEPEPTPPSEAEAGELDDPLDSTLDELTDALDDVSPAEGSDEEGAD